MKKQLNFLVLGIVVLCQISCQKTDPSTSFTEKNKNRNIKDLFLKTGPETDPTVQRVVREIEKRNTNSEFITEFAIKNGYPIWEKSILSFPKMGKSRNQHSFETSNDSLVYIPLVQQGGTQTNGFIRAVVNDSICLSYCLAKDYKNYSFSQQPGITTADQFATLFMVMDKNVFASREFEITDSRLLNESGGIGNSSQIRYAKILDITTGTNNLCEGTMYNISWLVQDAANCTCANGASNGGICQDWFTGCLACSNTVSITINVGAGSCGGSSGGGPIGGGTPISGGPSGAGSSNGGGQIPPYYPCSGNIPASLLPEPLPPCPPPGGGTGWNIPPNIAFFGLQTFTNNFSNPCIVAAKNKLPNFNLNIFANSLYFAPLSQTYNWNIVFEENRNLVNQDGSAKIAESFANTPNKEWHIVLNPLFWEQATQPNATQELAGLTILHEIVHGFIRVYKEFYNLSVLNTFNTHEIIFKQCVNAMALILKSSFSLSEIDAKALALQGLDDVLEKEYSSSGTLTLYNTQYNAFAVTNYGISIPDAEIIYDQFLSGSKGTRCY